MLARRIGRSTMAGAADFSAGGYRFLPSVFQFSAGVAALSGYAIERVRFRSPVPLKQGFERVERLITEAGRPLTAFCACELRSPAPFTEEGFRAFNQVYVGALREWGLFDGTINPVARSNVCPEIDPPGEPSFHAFCYTAASEDDAPSCVVSGSGEAKEGGSSYRERTVRLGETSADAMREKARYVLGEMERRLAALGFDWAGTNATQVYTVHDIHPFLANDRAPWRRGSRPDLAFRPPARARPRIRDGLPGRRGRTRSRCRVSSRRLGTCSWNQGSGH